MPIPLLMLLGAALLDFLIGDPWGWPHPVQAMGWAIARYQTWVCDRWAQPDRRRRAGLLLTLILVVGSGSFGWAIVQGGNACLPHLGDSLGTILLASCFAGRSLRDAAEDVLKPLCRGDLPQARQNLSRYVGRDTDTLDEPGILRALIETVTENATDGVLAPLFWAMVGASLPGVGPLPFALAYKAASTLDSMIGYRIEPYRDIGRCGARLEDRLTWLPCRLVVLSIALISGHPRRVLELCRRDAPADPSPNAGWSECAYAAALGIQLGGENHYRGQVRYKPLLGDPTRSLDQALVYQALELTRICYLIWLAIYSVITLYLFNSQTIHSIFQ